MALHDKLSEYLFEAGLNEAEVLVYLELLKAPVQTKWELVQSTGLDRNKVYRAFDRLKDFKMVDDSGVYISPMSLKGLVAELSLNSRKSGKLAQKIQNVAPYLKMSNEAVDEFEVLYTKDQILDSYMKMAELTYGMCLDYGDFEYFASDMVGMDNALKFRERRAKHAFSIALCTTTGPYTRCLTRETDLKKYKATVLPLKVDFSKKWVIFSDESDYVMFNDMVDDDYHCATLIRSKAVANTQRGLFDLFSQAFDN